MSNFPDHQGNDSGFTKEQWCETLHPLIKEEAQRRILDVAPAWRQRNASIDLQSTDEVVRAAAQLVIDAVNAIRVKSDEIEASLTSKSDADILAFDASDDAHWD